MANDHQAAAPGAWYVVNTQLMVQISLWMRQRVYPSADSSVFLKSIKEICQLRTTFPKNNAPVFSSISEQRPCKHNSGARVKDWPIPSHCTETTTKTPGCYSNSLPLQIQGFPGFIKHRKPHPRWTRPWQNIYDNYYFVLLKIWEGNTQLRTILNELYLKFDAILVNLNHRRIRAKRTQESHRDSSLPSLQRNTENTVASGLELAFLRKQGKLCIPEMARLKEPLVPVGTSKCHPQKQMFVNTHPPIRPTLLLLF